MKYVKRRNEFPDKEHYAVLVFKHQIIFDYRDSRNDYELNYVEYIQFSNAKELQDWILLCNAKDKIFKVINVRPVNIETKISVKVKEE